MNLKPLLLLFCLATLSGCATYYEQAAQTDCVTTHWYEEGFDAAKNGATKAETWNQLESSCSKYNMWSDRKSFDQGYDYGLTKFCTRSNGFEFGQRNRAYRPICSTDQQEIFDLAYADGERLYDATYNMETAISNLSSAEYTIRDGEDRRDYLANLIDSGTLDKDTEKKYVKERYSLKYEISSAHSSISDYRSDIARFTREQSSLEYDLFGKYYDNAEVDDKNSGYSAIKTAREKDIKLSEPAILLYKPEHMDRARKSHYKKLAKQINSYISTTVDRSFRYQVVRDTELVFNQGEKNEFRSIPARDFQYPALLLWDGQNDLSSIELPTAVNEPPLVELAKFIQLTARDKILVAEPEVAK